MRADVCGFPKAMGEVTSMLPAGSTGYGLALLGSWSLFFTSKSLNYVLAGRREEKDVKNTVCLKNIYSLLV